MSLKTLQRYNECIPAFASPSKLQVGSKSIAKTREQEPNTYNSHKVLPQYNQNVSLNEALSSHLNKPINSHRQSPQDEPKLTSRRVETVFELSLNDNIKPESEWQKQFERTNETLTGTDYS